MTTAPYPQVTNELLSAYIDEAVTEEERRLIERAVAEDADIAWRLESLRATVRLLRELPALSLPRSFMLTPEQVGQAAPALTQTSETATVPAKPLASPRRQAAEEGSGFWHDLRRGWGRFWQGGSPAMRNAMAASFAVLLALLIAPRFLANPSFASLGTVETAATQPQNQAVAQAPAAKQPTATSIPVAKQNAPATASVEPGQGTAAATSPAVPTAQPEQAQGAVVAAAVPQQSAAEPAAQPQAETAAQAATSSAAPAGDAPALGGSASAALAAGAPAGAPPAQAGRSMGSPSGSAAMDAAKAASDSAGPAPAAGPRIVNSSGPAAAPAAAQVTAPIAAASAGLASAYAVTGESEAAGAVVAGAPVTGVLMTGVIAAGEAAAPLTSADTQPAQTTPVATAAATVAAVAATAETETTGPTGTPAAAEPEAQSEPVAPVAVAAAASSNSAPAAVQRTAAEQAPGTQRGIPAWAGPTLQTAALLAALATLIFAILWWRSRRPTPPA